LTRRNLALLTVMPILYVATIVTDDFHHLIWRGFAFGDTVVPSHAAGTWLFIAYTYGLGIVNIVLFSWLILRSPPHRLPVAIMMAGQIGARVLYLLEVTNRVQSDLPLDVIMLAYLFLTYAVALFGFRIFSPIKQAQQIMIAQMRDGMVVLDPQGRVASLNPAASAMLGAPADSLLGRPIQELLPEYGNAGGDLETAGVDSIEICRGTEAEAKYYSLDFSALKDWRGLEIGRLLLLHDVTKLEQAQVQIIRQQRTHATLQERERLARELHDSLGQTLAATHLQASTARRSLALGETAQTDRYLEEMAKMTIDAEADVRDYLLGAKIAFPAGQPFFPALGLYLKRFGQQNGLQVRLILPPQVEAQGLEPVAEVQLMRIVQEALSNVRKHACAENVHLEFVDSGPHLQITICDDGRGFDLDKVARHPDGYGLQAMRERAEELGGSLRVVTQPGRGTEVVMQIPSNGESSTPSTDGRSPSSGDV